MDTLGPFLIVTFAATAPMRQVNIFILRVRFGHVFEPALLFLQDSLLHGRDAQISLLRLLRIAGFALTLASLVSLFRGCSRRGGSTIPILRCKIFIRLLSILSVVLLNFALLLLAFGFVSSTIGSHCDSLVAVLGNWAWIFYLFFNII